MPDIWVTTDLHLWSQDNDNRHPYRSQRQIDDLSNMFAQTLREDDILIFLGDLCDPEASDINKVAAFVRSIPCMKYMCRGNHDTEDDAYYFEAGFDRVCDLIRMHNIIFSHKPVKVAPDEINVHGHLHTQKMSGLSYQHINAYAMRWNKEGPLIRLGDLLASATVQNPDIGGETTSKMMEEFEFYTSLDNDHYRTIIDISDMVTADMISESYEDTLVNIICFNDWINENFRYGLRINGVWDPKRNTTAQDWDNYLVVQSPQEIERSKVGVCWDYTSYEAWYFKHNFPKVKVTTWYIVYGLQPDCPTHTFLTFTYQGNHYYFDSSFSDVAGVWAADSEKDILNFVIGSMVKHDGRLADVVKESNYGLFKYDALNAELYGLGCVEYMDWMLKNAKEIKHRYSDNYKTPVKMTAVLEAGTDILDEILFQDTDDTKYWMADDEKFRKTAEKGEESDKSVVAIDESMHFVKHKPSAGKSDNPFAKRWNNRVLYYVCSENMDDELYPIGKCLFESVPAAAFYWAIRENNGPGEYWVHTIEEGYYQLRSSDEVCGAWWSTDTINMWTVGKIRIRIEDGEWYMDWLFKYRDGIQVNCDTDGNILDETPVASTIDSDFKGGKKLKLNSFKRQELTEQLRKSYSEEYPMLRHFYSSDNFHKAYIWTDNKKIVAGLCVSKPDDKFPGQTWITSLEITKDYRGHGLSKQLLDFACRNCNANALGVAEDNEIARRLYEKYGFKYGDDVGKKDHNGTNRLMYLGETASILQEMAYEDAQDFMLAKLKHYCREFNRRDQEFERISKSWKKENPDCGDPPKLEVILHHGNENQILFIMVRDMDTDHYTPNQVASYWHLIKHLTDAVKKDEEVQNYAPINGISCEAEDIVGIYVNLNRGVQESVVETHPMDRDEKKSVADKYGLKAVGQTHEEEEKDAAIAKQKELDRKKKERLKQLEKGRRTQKRNRTIKKIKSHLPGVKNEDTAVDGSAAEYLTDPNANVELDPFNRRVKPMHKGAGDNDFDDSIHESASYQFAMMDNVQFFDGMTEAVGEDAEFAPVYVVLIRGNSPVSALISGFTGSEFTHASISFDSSLTEMYSFAGKNVANTLEAIIGGFKRENIQDKFYKENDIPYAVYLVESTKGAVKRMKKRLQYFIKNETKFRFDYLGLVKNFFKIPDDPKYTWFCSRFVADILNAGTPGSKIIDTPSLYRPEDFKTADFAQLVDRGMAANYTSRNVDRQTKIIAKAAKVRDAKLHEGAMYPDNPYSHQILQYQFAMMDEGTVDGFIQYLQSFKIRLDNDGNILITRREYDQLDSHFRESMRLIKAYESAGNAQGVKDELCKINYMITLINQYYLREDVKNLKPTAKDVRKDMLDLRSVMMNVFRQHLAWVTTQDPKWNFQRYYDNSKYGKNVTIPKKVITSVGRTIITALA
ncbi:MAG: GNAT family N-acetyltransferase [Muribaculaceae bacterium]|nr:GNAT family N-acetyltransferase [Muribaculaceae bacterium]